jgi:uncharacterized RDD family membrane protein YckC
MSEFDEILDIDTPENVMFGFDVAGIGSRFLAAVIDTLIILFLQIIVFFLILGMLSAGNLLESSEQAVFWVIGAAGLVGFLFLWGYYIFFELAWNGQTPGKRVAGLRVLKTDGTPIGAIEVIVRNLLRVLDFLPGYYGLGVVVMFIQKDSRRLGDLAAGTLVVREDHKTITLESLANTSSGASEFRPTVDGLGPLPIDRLEQDDFERIQSYLQRKSTITTGAGVAEHLLNDALQKMGFPAQDSLGGWETERILESIARAAPQ